MGRLVVARPGWHGDAEELQGVGAAVPVLEGRPHWNVDGDAGPQDGDTFVLGVTAPDFALTRQDMPEFADGCVDGGAVDLAGWDGAVDHVPGRALHEKPDIGPGG